MKRIIIFGAGAYAKRAYECYKDECEISCFLVTDKKNNAPSIDGITVCDFSDVDVKAINDTCIIVAVDEKYHDEIRNELTKILGDELLSNVKFLSKGDLDKIVREKRPYKAENFLKTIEPVSRLFGNDRGTPIDRYYIENYLEEVSNKLNKSGVSIEVGEDTYSKKYFPEYSHDILNYCDGMDLTKPETLPKEKYDVFICTQVFHEIYDVKKAIEGACHLLKKDGVLLSTVCGNITKMAHNDEYEHYWGFTVPSIKRMVEEAFGHEVSVEAYGNAAVATAFIQGVSLEEFDSGLLDAKDPEFTICISVTAVK